MAASDEMVVSRAIELQSALAAGRLAALQETAAQAPGMRELILQAEGRRGRVAYRLAWLGFAEAADALAGARYPLRGGVWMRAQSAWHAGQDWTVRRVGALPEPACCGQPPGLYEEQRR